MDTDGQPSAIDGARRGAGAIAVAQGLGQVVRIVGGLAVAALLGVELFGVVTWVYLAGQFLDDVGRDVGFGPSLIQQQREPTERELDSLFWVNAALGATVCVALVAFGPDVAELIGEPRVGDMLRLVGVSFLVSALATMNWAVLRRSMEFRKLALLQVVLATAGGALPVLLYVAGLGEWSVPWGMVATSCLVTTLSFVMVPRRPRARFAVDDVVPHLRFSRDLTASRLVAFGAANGDRFIVGVALGSTALGLYNFAFRVAMAPVQLLASVATEVLFPLLSRLQGQAEALAAAFRRSVALTGLAIGLPMTAVAVAAPDLVLVFDRLSDDDWTGGVTLLAVMAVVAIPQALMSVMMMSFAAAARTTLMLGWSTFTAVAALVSYWIGSRWGVEGVAWSFLIVMCVLFVPHVRITGALSGAGLLSVLRSLWPIAAAVASGGLVALGVSAVVDVEPLVDAAMSGVVVAVVSLSVLRVLQPTLIADLMSVLPLPSPVRRRLKIG